jgi:hypothetical protein
METLVRLSSLLSPSFFAILAGLSLTAAGLLFVGGRYNAAAPLVEDTKLSSLEPTEYRATGYLVLAFGWSIFGLVLGLIFGTIGARAYWSLTHIILSLPCLVLTLCFLYAGGATLLHAVIVQKGRPVPWFFPPMRYIDILIMRFGDLLTTAFLKPSLPQRVSGGVADAVEEPLTSVLSGHGRKRLIQAMETLHATLAEYETHLTSEQKERLMKLRGIVQELTNTHS